MTSNPEVMHQGRRWPEVGFGDIAMDVLQARFRVADNPGVADSSDPLGTATQSGWIASTSTRKL